jgi:NTP pyrophosphatase (non-canonical NTP hydrolase)
MSRMELRWRAERSEFDIPAQVDKIFEIAKDKLENQTFLITDEEVREKRISEVKKELAYWKRRVAADPWGIYGTLVGEKFKEEMADVFSWLAALIIKLDPSLVTFEKFPNRFTHQGEGGVPYLGCPWCHRERCSDACLLTHGVSSEIVEKISKF